ncbi:MAG: hypothetical protein GY820_15680 [Gammaproteobacteria bacterium]|nr:hypothetical protein [Gammaproteobacteria bacterium]
MNPTATPKDKRVVLDAATLIPLGHLLVLLTIVMYGAVWVTRIEGRLAGIEHTLETLAKHDWEASDMALWAEKLHAHNPSLDIPEVREP